jgi:hypothetical protein
MKLAVWFKRRLQRQIGRAPSPRVSGIEDSAAYAPSISLFYCDFFASRIARRLNPVEASDELAGIYIASSGFDELLNYWSDRHSLGRLVTKECRLSQPPLFYWVEWIPRDLNRARTGAFWGVQRHNFKYLSPELHKIRLAANRLASNRQLSAHGIRFVTPEDVLLAMVRLPNLRLGEQLVQSGIDVSRLEVAVRGGTASG